MWDRIAQQCIFQVLEPICEAKFYKYSFGFRTTKSAENAIAACAERINNNKRHRSGCLIIVFFDEV
jgi:retron-type reverse transcriptase